MERSWCGSVVSNKLASSAFNKLFQKFFFLEMMC